MSSIRLSRYGEVNLIKRNITRLPPRLWDFESDIMSLQASINNIESLPPGITRFTNLTLISLAYNKFTVFPEVLCSMPELQIINLTRNQITVIPQTISRLTNLQRLEIDGCEITSLPEELCSLTNLRNLNIRANRITKLPRNFSRLTQLCDLDISANPIYWFYTDLFIPGRKMDLLADKIRIYSDCPLPRDADEFDHMLSIYEIMDGDKSVLFACIPRDIVRLIKLYLPPLIVMRDGLFDRPCFPK